MCFYLCRVAGQAGDVCLVVNTGIDVAIALVTKGQVADEHYAGVVDAVNRETMFRPLPTRPWHPGAVSVLLTFCRWPLTLRPTEHL